MKVIKVILFVLLILLSSQILAQQQYIAADSTPTQTNNNNPVYLSPPTPPPTPNQLALNTNQTQDVLYSPEDQQEWFKNCMMTEKDPRIAKHAQEYCQCSWESIIAVVPAKNLISEDAKIVEATNGLLRSISSQCVIQVLANHGEAA